MTAPQDACEGVFDAMDTLCEAVRIAVEQDPDLDADTCTGAAWLRKDGVSVAFTQNLSNELTFTLQVPMDTIVAWVAEQEREQGSPA